MRMDTTAPPSPRFSRTLLDRTPRRRLAVSFVAVGALLSLTALTGCAASGAPEPAVTITITPGDSTAPNPTPTPPDVIHPSPVITVTVTPPAVTPPPVVTPVVTPAPEPTSSGNLIASVGAVSPGCTHSVCHYVHLAYTGLVPGHHEIQCVSDNAAVGAWSNYGNTFASSSGSIDLGCYLGYPGSHVWVIIDGVDESNHVNWTW
jgi:hypothetical protein